MSETMPVETKKEAPPVPSKVEQAKPQLAPTANPADPLSKFVPKPADQAPAAQVPVVPQAPRPKAKAKPRTKPKPKARAQRAPRQETVPLDLGSGHVIPLRTNSAYWIFTKTLARMSGFDKMAKELESVRSPSPVQAKEILSKMMVRKDQLIKKISGGSDYAEYGKVKIKMYKQSVKEGDRKAKTILTQSGRARGNTWVGDLEEVINVAKGSYTTKNRNGDKYRRAGIVVRSFPLKAKRNQPLFLMMFPKKYSAIVRQLISIGMGVSENMP
jgi:hypothetical protein